MKTMRVAVAGLSVTAATVVGLWMEEGWTERAVIPVKGDVPTVGPGLTKREDGSPVQMGDTIKPLEGIRRSMAHIQRDETGIKQCVTAPVSQAEYNLMVNFTYQYGVRRLCGSTMVTKTNTGDYAGACEAYLGYRFINKGKPNEYDCSTMVNGQRNKVCWGVWARSKERHQQCMAAQ